MRRCKISLAETNTIRIFSGFLDKTRIFPRNFAKIAHATIARSASGPALLTMKYFMLIFASRIHYAKHKVKYVYLIREILRLNAQIRPGL